MSGTIINHRQLNIEVDKGGLISILNNILKNTENGMELFINDNKTTIDEAIHKIGRFSYLDIIDSNTYMGRQSKFMNNDTITDIRKWGNEKEISIVNIHYLSDTRFVIALLEEEANIGVRTWLYILNKISYKECIIDDITIEYRKGFQFFNHSGSHIASMENGNLHYDYYPSTSYVDLISGDKHAMHFGTLILKELNYELDDLDIVLDEKLYDNMDEYEKLNHQKKILQRKISELKEKLPGLKDRIA